MFFFIQFLQNFNFLEKMQNFGFCTYRYAKRKKDVEFPRYQKSCNRCAMQQMKKIFIFFQLQAVEKL